MISNISRKLIVNADDLGVSEAVNNGIVESHVNGIVTSSTLMVTMPAVEHGVHCARTTRLDVGLHIDLTWGHCASPASQISSLANADGQFRGKMPLLKSLALRQVKSEHIEKEISAQIEKFRETGLPLFHVDVHQHFHGFPIIMKSLAKVVKREKIPFIRLVNEATVGKPVNSFIYLMFLLAKRHFPAQHRATDHFLGLALTNRLEKNSLALQLEKVKPGLTELMCHPGYNDPDLDHLSRLQAREAEVEALTSDTIKNIISSRNITLTTFRDETLHHTS